MGQMETVKGHTCWLLIVGRWSLFVDVDIDGGDVKIPKSSDLQLRSLLVSTMSKPVIRLLWLSFLFSLQSFPSHHIRTQNAVEVTHLRRSTTH